MNREIKFRAWIKKRKDYRELDQLGFDNQGIEEVWVFPKDGEIQQVYNPLDVVVEQYTGLKDKNGKEIYEGDIMRYDAIDYKVLWADYYAGFETKRLNSPWNNAGLTLHFLASVGRVIGNIHENPELLEDEEHGE